MFARVWRFLRSLFSFRQFRRGVLPVGGSGKVCQMSPAKLRRARQVLKRQRLVTFAIPPDL